MKDIESNGDLSVIAVRKKVGLLSSAPMELSWAQQKKSEAAHLWAHYPQGREMGWGTLCIWLPAKTGQGQGNMGVLTPGFADRLLVCGMSPLSRGRSWSWYSR